MYRLDFNDVSQMRGIWAPRIRINQVQDVYFDVVDAIMIFLVEVAGDMIIQIFRLNCLEACLKPVHEAVHALAHILHTTFLGFNAIYEVTGLAGDI